jgi:hypothetical protein
MFEFFKTMKDSFHGNRKKDCYRDGLFVSEEMRGFMSSDEKKAEVYAKMTKKHFRTMSIWFWVSISSLTVDKIITGEFHFALPAIFGFHSLIQLFSWMASVNKSMELMHQRLSKMEETSAQSLLKQQETTSAA